MRLRGGPILTYGRDGADYTAIFRTVPQRHEGGFTKGVINGRILSIIPVMDDKLTAYRKKRNFGKTREPFGGGETDGSRFVIQKHASRRPHYDLRLERKGVLLSWAIPKAPSFRPSDKRLAVRVEDHPVEYADFEGTIPQGEYGAGAVMIWDEGRWETDGDFDKELKAGSVKLTLYGKRLKGGWALVKLKDGDNWLFIKERDIYAGATEITDEATSVRSGRTMAEIKRGAAFSFPEIKPMLPLPAERPPDGDEMLFEVKYDGYRILAHADGKGVRLLSRNGKDYSRFFPHIVQAVSALAGGSRLVVDGEIIAADKNGRSDFAALGRLLRSSDRSDAVYMAFDLLISGENDLRGSPLVRRKSALQKLIKKSDGCVKLSRHVVGRGKECFQAAAALGLEGIIAKRADSPYVGGRSGDWLKIKCHFEREFVAGGFAKKNGARNAASLLLGAYCGKRFIYFGRVAVRDTDEAERLYSALKKQAAGKPPFAQPPEAKNGELLVWLKPRTVVQIRFAGYTGKGLIRHAVYLGVRDDKPPREVYSDTTSSYAASETDCCAENDGRKKRAAVPANGKRSIDGVEITNPDRIIFTDKGVTKLDVAEYYAAAAKRFLRYAGGRILSVVRCHNGDLSACFFKKHPAAGEKVKTVETFSRGKSRQFFYVTDKEELAAQAQLGTLEFHIQGSLAADHDRPDTLVFDLDPDEGLPVDKVRQGAKDLKKTLSSLGLKSFVKTSGGKGYHIVSPVAPYPDWESFRDFARGVAELMCLRWPERYTANMRKKERVGKIFIDWARNTRGATFVAPYSLRARKGATVSMPISWKEIDAVAPDGVDIRDAAARLKKPDPWKGYFSLRQKPER